MYSERFHLTVLAVAFVLLAWAYIRRNRLSASDVLSLKETPRFPWDVEERRRQYRFYVQHDAAVWTFLAIIYSATAVMWCWPQQRWAMGLAITNVWLTYGVCRAKASKALRQIERGERFVVTIDPVISRRIAHYDSLRSSPAQTVEQQHAEKQFQMLSAEAFRMWIEHAIGIINAELIGIEAQLPEASTNFNLVGELEAGLNSLFSYIDPKAWPTRYQPDEELRELLAKFDDVRSELIELRRQPLEISGLDDELLLRRIQRQMER